MNITSFLFLGLVILLIPTTIKVFGSVGFINDNETRFRIVEHEDFSFTVYEKTNNQTETEGYDDITNLTQEWLIPYFEDSGIELMIVDEEEPATEEEVEEEVEEDNNGDSGGGNGSDNPIDCDFETQRIVNLECEDRPQPEPEPEPEPEPTEESQEDEEEDDSNGTE